MLVLVLCLCVNVSIVLNNDPFKWIIIFGYLIEKLEVPQTGIC